MSARPLNQLPESELFYPFRADQIPAKGKNAHIEADAAQLKAIAARLEVKAVKSLVADVHMELQNGGHILYISGNLKSDIVQECVVTADPVESHIEDSFEAWYADHEKAVPFIRAKHQVQSILEGDEAQMLEEKDDPEPLVDGQVDLGEVVIQFLSLSIDPYPRKEGAEAEIVNLAEVTEEKSQPSADSKAASLRPNPFAALKNWRPKD